MAGNKPGNQGRRYTDTEKATAIAFVHAANGNLITASKQTGIPRQTLAKWVKGKEIKDTVYDILADKKEDLADLFEGIARKYINHALDQDVIDFTSGKDAVITAATAVDKMRLLRNQPTTIAGKAELTDDELVERLRAIAERAIRERQAPDASGSQRTEIAYERTGEAGTDTPA